jgi:hypothetical protein
MRIRRLSEAHQPHRGGRIIERPASVVRAGRGVPSMRCCPHRHRLSAAARGLIKVSDDGIGMDAAGRSRHSAMPPRSFLTTR